MTSPARLDVSTTPWNDSAFALGPEARTTASPVFLTVMPQVDAAPLGSIDVNQFDTHARDWEIDPHRQKQAKRVARASVETMCPGGQQPSPDLDVLEIGAGTGQLATEIAALATPATWTFTLTDTSEGMRKVAAKRTSDRGWRVLDRDYSDPTTSLDDGRYDLVIAHMVLHHVEDVSMLFGSVHTMLKPDGSFIAIDLTEKEGRTFHVHHSPARDAEDPRHYHDGFTETTMRGLCMKAGFSQMTWSVPLTIKREREGRLVEFPLFLARAQR